jgi:hypothetical protein
VRVNAQKPDGAGFVGVEYVHNVPTEKYWRKVK